MTQPVPKLRVFAGPNGSGKSTIIEAVRTHKVNNKFVDLGMYVNADDIAQILRDGLFSFDVFEINTTLEHFASIVDKSGLLQSSFTSKEFLGSFDFQQNSIQLTNPDADERLAQIIADFLRKELLSQKRKFSFETVFSHPSKLDIMRQAAEAGYKVYLYFVSTESPDINVSRVEVRTRQGGHNVPEPKIRERYSKALNLLYEAAQLAHQVFFFDNSQSELNLFAHFKTNNGEKDWETNPEQFPGWFIQYYLNKINQHK